MTKHGFRKDNEPARLQFFDLSEVFTAVPVVDDPNVFMTTALSNKE